MFRQCSRLPTNGISPWPLIPAPADPGGENPCKSVCTCSRSANLQELKLKLKLVVIPISGSQERAITMDSHSECEESVSDLSQVTRILRPQKTAMATTNTLFYAYAHQTNDWLATRYLLTFANAGIAQEWWEGVFEMLSDKANRHGAQLFSFEGENVLYSIWTNKKLSHLKMKWFYSKFGDDIPQVVIPLQEENGDLVVAPSDSAPTADVDTPKVNGVPALGESIESSSITRAIDSLQNIVKQNATQITALTMHVTNSHEYSERNKTEEIFEALEQMQRVVQQNNVQIESLSSSQTQPLRAQTTDPALEELQKLIEIQSAQLEKLITREEKAQKKLQRLLEQNLSSMKDIASSTTTAVESIRPTNTSDQTAKLISALESLNSVQKKGLSTQEAMAKQIGSSMEHHQMQMKSFVDSQQNLMTGLRDTLITALKRSPPISPDLSLRSGMTGSGLGFGDSLPNTPRRRPPKLAPKSPEKS